MSPGSGPAGTTFVITFSDLQVGQPFYLYRMSNCVGGSCQWKFVATLLAQQRDAAGRAIYRLTTRPGDPLGKYVVQTRPQPPRTVNMLDTFDLTTSDQVRNTPTPRIGGLPTRLAPPVPGKLAPPNAPTSTPTRRPVALRARIVSPAIGATTITKGLTFQVEAYDAKVGAKDGAGVDRVEMSVIDSKNRIVHKRTDTSAAYCAFGGGAPKCTVYAFGEHKNLWSNGTPIGGAYTLRAVVYGKSGGTLTVEAKVTIRP